MDNKSEIVCFGEILIRIRWLTNSKYINIVLAKNLTFIDHGLAMRVLLPSTQHASEMKDKISS